MSNEESADVPIVEESPISPTSFNQVVLEPIIDKGAARVWNRFKRTLKESLDIDDFAELQYLTEEELCRIQPPENKVYYIGKDSIVHIKDIMQRFSINITIGSKKGYESPNIKTLMFLGHLTSTSHFLLKDLGYNEIPIDLTLQDFETDINNLKSRKIDIFTHAYNEVRNFLQLRTDLLNKEIEP